MERTVEGTTAAEAKNDGVEQDGFFRGEGQPERKAPGGRKHVVGHDMNRDSVDPEFLHHERADRRTGGQLYHVLAREEGGGLDVSRRHDILGFMPQQDVRGHGAAGGRQHGDFEQRDREVLERPCADLDDEPDDLHDGGGVDEGVAFGPVREVLGGEEGWAGDEATTVRVEELSG